MPFTPFHLGPGALIKSLIPRWFSFRVFVLSQIVIDCETAWNIFNAHDRLHTFFHSYIGVNVAILITLAIAVFYSQIAHLLVNAKDLRTNLFKPPAPLAVVTAAIVGGWSHVFLDSIMHSDMRPFWPLTEVNSSLELIDVGRLHLYCLAGFVGAGIVLGLRAIFRQRRR